ncbi:MAG: hypothetical protein KY392_04195, partial [Chloroflexi bacterium]|nr:hypothetical protein [Chloroflexota bacterium]
PEEPPASGGAVAPDEPSAPSPRGGEATSAPRDDRAVAVELGPVVVAEGQRQDADDDDQADPHEVRRQIATASRAFDSDRQVRRAMDAFFSPAAFPTDKDRTTPDH